MDFIHHPDGYISLDGVIYPLAFWALVEPAYSLPANFVGREFVTEGAETIRHHLIKANGDQNQPTDWTWLDGQAYEAQVGDYASAYSAYQAGATVSRENGVIVIKSIELVASAAQVDADGVAEVTLTATANNGAFTGQVSWVATAPDGEESAPTLQNMVAGVATIPFSTLQVGLHTIRISGHGSVSVTVEGI